MSTEKIPLHKYYGWHWDDHLCKIHHYQCIIPINDDTIECLFFGTIDLGIESRGKKVDKFPMEIMNSDPSGYFKIKYDSWNKKLDFNTFIGYYGESITQSDFSRIWFNHNASLFFDMNTKITKSLNDVTNQEIIIITSAYAFNRESKNWIPVKTFIQFDKCTMTTNDGRVYPFSKCMMCYDREEYGEENYRSYISKYHIVPFTEIPIFAPSDKPSNYSNLQGNISIHPVPSYRKNCYKSFLEDFESPNKLLFGYDIIILIPKYLNSIFGDESPIFLGKDFKQTERSGHPIEMLESFKLLIKWTKHLIVNNEWPNVDEMIKYEFDLKYWLEIADYFDIPAFVEFFLMLIKQLEVSIQ